MRNTSCDVREPTRTCISDLFIEPLTKTLEKFDRLKFKSVSLPDRSGCPNGFRLFLGPKESVYPYTKCTYPKDVKFAISIWLRNQRSKDEFRLDGFPSFFHRLKTCSLAGNGNNGKLKNYLSSYTHVLFLLRRQHQKYLWSERAGDIIFT